MEYRYSSVLDPEIYRESTDGLLEGIPVRFHHDHEIEDLAILRLHQDWKANVGPLGNFRGTLHPRHSFMSLTVPECLPERLDVLSYANEFGFLHDDEFESQQGVDAMRTMAEGFGADGEDLAKQAAANISSGKRRLQSHLMLRMLSIDREIGTSVITMWTEFLTNNADRAEAQFSTLADYLRYRIEEVGSNLEIGLLMFGCRIPATDQERQTCFDLGLPAWTALSLTNDLFSWEKEHRSAVASNKTSYISNSLFLIMKENNMDLSEAKELCRRLIRENMLKYMQVLKDVKQPGKYPSNVVKLLEALLYVMSGNLVWSASCPRYHPEEEYNEQQREWMAKGLPKHLLKEKLVPPPKQTRANGAGTNGVNGHGVNGVSGVNGVNGNGAKTNGVNGVNGTNGTNGNATKKRKHEHTTDSDMTNGNGNGHGNLNGATTKVNGIPPKKTHRWMPAADRPLDEVLGDHQLAPLSSDVIDGPSKYIASLPGKGVRSKVIDALNIWYQVPASSVQIIKRIVDLLHQASLMLDDIQDGSQLRRGKPSTHTIFGLGQTINSSSYKICEALEEVLKLNSLECVHIVIEESKALYIGQSLDLHWSTNLEVPSVEDYIKVLDAKTGGLITLLGRLLEATSPLVHKPRLASLAATLGRAYALRDDYQNLASAEYTQTKGFCEDLDEGKYSLPIIHMLHTLPSYQRGVLHNLLTQRRLKGSMGIEQKRMVLEMMDQAGSLDYTLNAVRRLQGDMEHELDVVEQETGVENFELRALFEMIKI